MYDQEHEELIMLHQISSNDLAFFKRQQWAVTNYAILIYAALLTINQQLISNVTVWHRLVFIILTVATAISALLIIRELQEAIACRQKRLDKIIEKFSDTFQDVRGICQTRYNHVPHLLSMVIIVGLVASIWLFLVEL